MDYKNLLGRPFKHGSADCYGLLRDYYKQKYGIELTDYARPDDWWDKGMNLYMDNFYAEGFRLQDVPIYKVEKGDVLLVAVRSSVANHCGIVVGPNKVIHHMYGRFSEEHDLKGMFRDSVCAILRHKDVTNEQVEDTVQLIDLLLPHKRKMIEDAIKASGSTSVERSPSQGA